MVDGDSRKPGQRSRDARAQTAQDFVVGIGVFLLALTFVVGYFPQLAGVYDAGSGGAREASLADRTASTVLQDLTTDGSQNEVDRSRAVTYFQTSLAEATVRSTLTIPNTKFVNITIQTLDRSAVVTIPTASGNVRLDGGHEYDNQSALTLSRIVTLQRSPGVCNPTCRLVVRVW